LKADGASIFQVPSAGGVLMSNGNSLFVINDEADKLQVCRDCGGLYGSCFLDDSSFEQLCRCRRNDEALWPGFDFNEAVTLCHSCGLEPLRSGSRWSVWFCEPCKQVVTSLNDACRDYVIPIGRHSIQGCRWQGELCVHAGQSDIDAFVNSLESMSERIDRLKVHAQHAVKENCRVGGYTSSNPTTPEYIASVRGELLLRSIRIHELLDRFAVPASIANRVATDNRN
jgi:hypothetical protein